MTDFRITEDELKKYTIGGSKEKKYSHGTFKLTEDELKKYTTPTKKASKPQNKNIVKAEGTADEAVSAAKGKPKSGSLSAYEEAVRRSFNDASGNYNPQTGINEGYGTVTPGAKPISALLNVIYNKAVNPLANKAYNVYEKLDDYAANEDDISRMKAAADEQAQGQAFNDESLRLNRALNERKEWLSGMTDEQKRTYLALPERERKDYLDSIEDELNQKAGIKEAQYILGQGKETASPEGYAFAAGVQNFKSGLEGAVNLLRGKEGVTAARGDLEYAYGAVAPTLEGVHKTLSDYAYTTGNMVPSMALGFINPVAGRAAMFASSAGNSYDQSIREGYTPEKSAAYGIPIGLKEVALSYLLGAIPGISSAENIITRNVGNVGNKILGTVIKNEPLRAAASNLIGRVVAEGAEETAQEWIEPALQNMILGQNNNLNFFTDKDLRNRMAYAGFLGGLSGGTFNIPGSVNVYNGVKAQRAGVDTSNISNTDTTNGLQTEQNTAENSAKVENGAEGNTETAENIVTNNNETADSSDIKANETEIVKRDMSNADEQTMQNIKNQYEHSTDLGLVNFIKTVRNTAKNGWMKFKLKNVTDSSAEDIRRLTGVNVRGFETEIGGSAITHIDRRHGVNGKADSTMADVNDMARVQFVIDDYDSIRLTGKTNREYKNADGTPAKTVELVKRVNGKFYVVEAVPDSAKHTVHIVSMYKSQIKTGERQVPDAAQISTPHSDGQTELGLSPDNSISNNTENINSLGAETEITEGQNTESLQPEATDDLTTTEEETAPPAEEEVQESAERAAMRRRALETVNRNSPDAQRIYREIMSNYGYGKVIQNMDAAAKKLGTKITYYAEDGRAEGYAEDGSIYLNVKNLRSTQEGVWRLFKHELSHTLQGATKAYGKLFSSKAGQELFNKFLKDNGYTNITELENEIRSRYSKNGKNLTEEELNYELMARFIEGSDILNSEESIRKLTEASPNLAQRIIEWFKYMRTRFKGTEYDKQLAQAERLYLKAVKEAQRNGAYSGGQETGKNHSLRDVRVPESYEELTSKPDIEIVDIRNSYGKSIKNIESSLKKSGIYNEPVINKDTNESIFFNGKGVAHSISNGGVENVYASEHMPEIIENAVLAFKQNDRHERSTADQVYVFFGAVRGEKGCYPVKLMIKEYDISKQANLPENVKSYFEKNGKSQMYATLYDNKVVGKVFNVEDIEIAGEIPYISQGGSGKQNGNPGYEYSPATTISVAELLKNVNEETRKYIPAKVDTGNNGTGRQYSIASESETGDTETSLQGEETERKTGSIKTDGKKNIAFLDGLKIDRQPGEKRNEAIKRFFNNNFKNKEIEIIENQEKVTTDQIGKYLYPGEIRQNYDVKINSIPILDDIIKVATNKTHSADLLVNGQKKNHSGLDATNGWDYYDTLFAVDDSGVIWGGKVVVRDAKNGKSYFYDLDEIRVVGYQDVNEFNPVEYGQTTLTNNILPKNEFDNTKLDGNNRQYSIAEETETGDTLSRKSEDYIRSSTNRLLNEFMSITGTSRFADTKSIKADINSFAEECVRTGKIDKDKANKLFDKVWSDALYKNDEMYTQYKDVAQKIKSTALYGEGLGSLKTKYKQEYRNKIKLTDDPSARKIDSFYNELCETNPELFDPNITNIEDQIPAMAEVVDAVRITYDGLKDTFSDYDAESADARDYFMESLDQFINDVSHYETGKKEINSKRTETEKTSREVTEKFLTDKDYREEVYKGYNDAKKEYEKALSKKILTPRENEILSLIYKGTLSIDELSGMKGINAKAIERIYPKYETYRNTQQAIADSKKAARVPYKELAERAAEGSDGWKDKKRGISYSTEIMERNIEDITKRNGGRKNDEAKFINDNYFKPIHHNEAEATRYKNSLTERINALNLKNKKLYRVPVRDEISGVPTEQLVSERALVQLYGEGLITEQTLSKTGADVEKIKRAKEEMRSIYDELFDKANEALIRNGYEPIAKRADYFPHFTEDRPDTLLGKAAAAVGIDITGDALPTDIAGITNTFRPGKKWVGNFLRREGTKTDYDVLKGFDRYIGPVSDVIYHTDDIQRLRAFETELRYKYSDKGIQDRIEQIRNDETLTPEDRNNRLEALYKASKMSHLPNLVTQLRSYTDTLAGKKHKADRFIEDTAGRGVYKFLKSAYSKTGANMVAVNVGSWLTNFVPVTQALGVVRCDSMAKAIFDTIKAQVQSDGFVEKSDFLINRRGSENVSKTMGDIAAGYLTKPFEIIDNLSAEIVTRAIYYDNMRTSLNESTALEYANDMAARLMADRSKGSVPTAFNVQNPLIKTFTMFQLEANNQYKYYFKDVPADVRTRATGTLATAFFKMFLAAFLYNKLYKKIVGRNAAPDPIDITLSAIGNYKEAYKGNQSYFKATVSTAKDIAEEAPFIGGLLGGGRVPMSSVVPDAGKLLEAGIGLATGEIDEKKAMATITQELMNPALYLLMPIGGGQLKKTAQGLKTVWDGGEYTYDKDGNKKLKYPIDKSDPLKTKAKYVQAAVFGKSALPEAQYYYDQGFKALTVKQTEQYPKVIAAGITYQQYMEALMAARKAESDKDENGKTIPLSSARNKKRAIDKVADEYGLTERQRKILYEANGVSEKIL